jgi:hypothetical protein
MSCLFNSLAPAVGIKSEDLRTVIVQYLQTNPVLLDDIKARDIISWSENTSLQDYAARMTQAHTWGGAIEIRAFCELYGTNVCVHVLYTQRIFTFECSRLATKTVHISYTGSHFEPLYTEILQ